MKNNKLYINVWDYQGGNWAVGEVGNLKHWRTLAMQWADSDESWDLYSALKNYKIKNEDLIKYINDMWEIEIVEFNPLSKDHLELKQKREEF